MWKNSDGINYIMLTGSLPMMFRQHVRGGKCPNLVLEGIDVLLLAQVDELRRLKYLFNVSCVRINPPTYWTFLRMEIPSNMYLSPHSDYFFCSSLIMS